MIDCVNYFHFYLEMLNQVDYTNLNQIQKNFLESYLKSTSHLNDLVENFENNNDKIKELEAENGNLRQENSDLKVKLLVLDNIENLYKTEVINSNKLFEENAGLKTVLASKEKEIDDLKKRKSEEENRMKSKFREIMQQFYPEPEMEAAGIKKEIPTPPTTVCVSSFNGAVQMPYSSNEFSTTIKIDSIGGINNQTLNLKPANANENENENKPTTSGIRNETASKFIQNSSTSVFAKSMNVDSTKDLTSQNSEPQQEKEKTQSHSLPLLKNEPEQESLLARNTSVNISTFYCASFETSVMDKPEVENTSQGMSFGIKSESLAPSFGLLNFNPIHTDKEDSSDEVIFIKSVNVRPNRSNLKLNLYFFILLKTKN